VIALSRDVHFERPRISFPVPPRSFRGSRWPRSHPTSGLPGLRLRPLWGTANWQTEPIPKVAVVCRYMAANWQSQQNHRSRESAKISLPNFHSLPARSKLASPNWVKLQRFCKNDKSRRQRRSISLFPHLPNDGNKKGQSTGRLRVRKARNSSSFCWTHSCLGDMDRIKERNNVGFQAPRVDATSRRRDTCSIRCFCGGNSHRSSVL
jgi:hypothetical protein